jgi:hypothetical protein
VRDMKQMQRREFFTAAAMTVGGAALAGAAPADGGVPQAKTPAAPKPGFKSRPAGKVEFLFKCPGNTSNGMQCTEEGIWTIDPAGSRTDTPGRCKVYLSSYEGKLLRELSPEGTGPSGIGFDGKSIWIGSTYSREIIRADAKTGETMEKHMTPGAGVIYRMTTDLPARPDTYGQSVRAQAGEGANAPAGGRAGGRGGRGAGGRGQGVPGADGPTSFPGPPGPGTGAHGQQIQNGKLWMSVPPGRMIYRVDPATWMVEHMFPTVANRPHGIGIESENATHLWESDTNMGAFFKRDMVTGEVVDSIRLADGDPFPHGMSVYKGYIYWCDDIGGGNAPVCRVKI